MAGTGGFKIHKVSFEKKCLQGNHEALQIRSKKDPTYYLMSFSHLLIIEMVLILVNIRD